MKYVLPFIIFFSVMIFACSSDSQTDLKYRNSDNQSRQELYYGNIYGTISDENSGKPIKDAVIYVVDMPVRYLSADDPDTVLSDQGPVVIPERSTAVRRAYSRADGSFLISSIPIHGSSQLYTVVIEADVRDILVIDQVPVLPGASMALKLDCKMTSAGHARIVKCLNGHRNVDIHYSDELNNNSGKKFN